MRDVRLKSKTDKEFALNLISRPRRNRKSKAVREAIAETSLRPESLIQPLFVAEKTEKIPALFDQQKLSLADLKSFCEERLKTSNIMGVLLFALSLIHI